MLLDSGNAAVVAELKVITHQDKIRTERFGYHEVNPAIIKEKSNREIIQAIDKWLTPIVLYAILLELLQNMNGRKQYIG